MNYDVIDTRKSVWDIGLREFNINGQHYRLQGEPDRGGTCIVYDVIKEELIDGNKYERRLLLKEFYPIFDMDDSVEIRRSAEGNLIVPEYVQNLKSYQIRLDRFKDSYRMFTELGKYVSLVEHMAIAVSLFTDGNTWYIEEAWDSGASFNQVIDWNLILSRFLFYFEECAWTVQKLHEMGFYHLDLKPSNISCTAQGVVRLFDTDSFIRKEDLGKRESWSTAGYYSAPEIRSVRYSPEDARYLIGPWTDIYSLGQIFCTYLFGHPLVEEDMESYLERLYELVDEKAGFLECFEDECVHVSGNCIYHIKQFIRKSLNRQLKSRYQSVDAMIDDLAIIRNRLNDEALRDNFVDSHQKRPQYAAVLERIHKGMEENFMVCLVGENPEQREAIARQYATEHRAVYLSIVEVHLNDFNDLAPKIDPLFSEMTDLEAVLSRNLMPSLLLVFDDKEENELEIGETYNVTELQYMEGVHVLIVGRYDRFKTFNKQDFDYPKIDLDADETGVVQKEEAYGFKFIKGLALLAACCVGGRAIWGQAANLTDMAYNSRYSTVFGYSVPIQWGILLELLAVVLFAIGFVGFIYVSVYSHYKPQGIKSFFRTYRLSISTIFLAWSVFSIPPLYYYTSENYLSYVYGWDSFVMDILYGSNPSIFLLITIGFEFIFICSVFWERKVLAKIQRLLSLTASTFFLGLGFIGTYTNLWRFALLVVIWFLVYVCLGLIAGRDGKKENSLIKRRIAAWMFMAAILTGVIGLANKNQFETEEDAKIRLEEVMEAQRSMLEDSLASVQENTEHLAFYITYSDLDRNIICEKVLDRLAFAYDASVAYVYFNHEIYGDMEDIGWMAPEEDYYASTLEELKSYFSEIDLAEKPQDLLENVSAGWKYYPLENSSVDWSPVYMGDEHSYIISYVEPVYIEDKLVCVIGMDMDVHAVTEDNAKYLPEDYNLVLETKDGQSIYELLKVEAMEWETMILNDDLILHISIPDKNVGVSNFVRLVQIIAPAVIIAYMYVMKKEE